MRFEYLEFSGIGPFRKVHRIDFSQINTEGLFLIEGPTGSGKSTIIDAISFALFGGVAGNDSSKQRLRSSHAEDHEDSWVDFVFTISSGTYRIRRTPEYLRKAKRGDGVTTRKSTVALWRISAEQLRERNWENGQPIATKAREVGIELGKLFPLSREQFLQTVVLPQGQFAQFLKLKSTEREAILATIFNTRDYQEFTKALVEHGKAKLTEVNTAKVKFEQRIQDFRKLESLSEIFLTETSRITETLFAFTIPNEISEIAKFTDSLNAEVQKIKAAAKAEETTAADAKIKLKEAQERYHDVVDKQQRQQKYFHLKTQLTDLASKNEQIEADQEKLEKHSQAVELVALFTKAASSIDAAEKHYQEFLTQSAETEVEAENLPNIFALAQWNAEKLNSTWKKLQQDQENFAAKIEELKQTLAKIQELHELKAQGQQLEDESAEIKTQNIELQKSEAKLAEKLQIKNELEIHLQEIEQNLNNERAREKELKAQQKDFAELEILEKEKTRQETKTNSTEKDFQTKRTELDAAFNAWIGAAPATLAQKLKLNEPCLVCGAIEHPNPAKIDNASHITDEEILVLKAEHDELLQEAQSEQKKLQDLQREVDHYESRKQYSTLTDLETAIATNGEKIEKLKTDFSQANASLTDLTKSQETLEKDKQRLQENINKLAHLAGKIESLKQQIGAQEKALEDKELDIAELTRELIAESEKSEKLAQALDFFRSFEQETYRALEAQDSATHSLEKSIFTDYTQAKNSVLPAAQSTALKERINSHFEETIAIKAQLTALDISDLLLEEKYDPEPFSKTLLEAETKHHRAVESAARASKNYENALHISQEAKEYAQQWETLAISGGVILRLVDLATASNATDSRIPLNIWILTQRFEQIVERANQHLQQISSGRYELIRTTEEGRIKKSGLGLSIIDRDGSAQGDVIRPTTSLSGGETFYTSLALALALAEVVQEENGGIHINTLIIDEGFGSLSDSVLDEVMNSLQNLRDAGRTVGIVSHVAELKSRITSKITVRKLDRGQSTLSLN
ncbi:MAG: SMC family ATPase [Arcanobacterium sp.]|nr:SMC family ATPase [Arcanobacterium sp.]